MVICSQSNPGVSQTPHPNNNNPTASGVVQGSSRSNPNATNDDRNESKLDARHHQQELDVAHQDEIDNAAERAHSAAATDASGSLPSIPLIGQEHADRIDLLLDFDDLLMDDMDVDDDPEVSHSKTPDSR